ncbi:MAG: GntR family transcriptional regulator [Clostridiaceae bacterium]
MILDGLTRKSLTEQIYDRLRHDITRKIIKCNEKIEINKLKETLKTSQTPIREALMKLEHEGLVEFIPNVGARVISISQQDIKEVFDVNRMCDCEAICLALKSEQVESLINELKFHVEAHAKIVEMQPSEEYWYQAQQVHGVFYKYADNKVLSKIALQIQGKADMLFGGYILLEKNRHCGVEEHFMIYEAVSNRDADKAVEYMRLHWENAKLRLIQWCDKDGYC